MTYPTLILGYDPSIFDELYDFHIARTILQQLGPAVTSLGDIICEYELHEHVAANLLHKHFSLLKGERVVRETNNGIAYMRPCSYDDNPPENVLPYLWQFADGQQGRHFYPLEFAIYSVEDVEIAKTQIELISSNAQFLKEFANRLWQLGLEDIFGIAARSSRLELVLPPGHELLETTDSINRVLTLEAVDEKTLRDADTTETLWIFTPPSNQKVACRNSV